MSAYEARARDRMAAAVTRALHVHLHARPLLAEGLVVEHSSGSIWAVATLEGREVLARVHDSAWWEPRLRTEEDQAGMIATRLVEGLERQHGLRNR